MAVKKKIISLNPITNPSIQGRPKSVSELKRKYKNLPLHFLFGIEPEIEYQCPLLDVNLNQISETQKALEKIRRCRSLNAAKTNAAVGLHEISSTYKEIDEVTRTNFENLRRMAEGWKQLAIAAMNETKNPEKFLKI